MIESVMLWNELNNPAHWHGGRVGRDPWRIEDPDWRLGLDMVRRAATALEDAPPATERILSGLSPPDPEFLALADDAGVLEHVDAVAAHNFWFDFGPASRRGESALDHLAEGVDALRTATCERLGEPLPVVVSEVGVTSFAGDAAQKWAASRTIDALDGLIDRLPSTRVTWYSLFDLPEEYIVTSLYEPGSYGEIRHRKFGLYRSEDEVFRPKPAAEAFARRRHAVRIGITQWFRMPWPDDEHGLSAEQAHDVSYRVLEAAPPILRELDVEWLRINVTWADWDAATGGDLENGLEWFDDLMDALAEFRLIVTIFQAPPRRVREADDYRPGSVPRDDAIDGLRDTALEVLRRYAATGCRDG